MWRNKAKEQWLIERDANTHFFHVTTINNRRRNHIHPLYTSGGRNIFHQNKIGEAFMDFFIYQFQTEYHDYPQDL